MRVRTYRVCECVRDRACVQKFLVCACVSFSCVLEFPVRACVFELLMCVCVSMYLIRARPGVCVRASRVCLELLLCVRVRVCVSKLF